MNFAILICEIFLYTMDIKTLLGRLGFTDNEGTIYFELVETGPTTVAALAHKTGLHRPTVYKTLPLLQARGLVTPAKKGARTLFVAEPPEKLEVLLHETETAFSRILPELQAAYTSKEKRPVVKVLEGKQGITFVFDDLVKTLKRGDVFYRYSSVRASRDAYLPKNYREIRDAKKLERFVITNTTRAKEKKPRMERAIKIVPERYGLFDQDVTQVIYGDKVAFVDYNSQTALLVENPALAEFQRKLFQMLYDLL